MSAKSFISVSRKSIFAPANAAFWLALAGFLLTTEPQAAGPLSHEPLYAGVRVYYGPGEGFESIDAQLINSARHSLDMAAYVLTDRALVAAARPILRFLEKPIRTMI